MDIQVLPSLFLRSVHLKHGPTENADLRKCMINTRLLSAFVLLALSTARGQTLLPTMLTPLNTTLNETSGLLVINGHVWTQLDSGNAHELYEIDITTGEVLRTVTVTNASNIDWEEITSDGERVYIGDFGNNVGSRTNLRIYSFALSELSDPGTTEVEVDTIAFSYADQVDFTPANGGTNWDCEAMVAMDDSLFLFTKNWQNNECYIYSLPAAPGIHTAQRRDTLDTQGLVTGASRDPINGGLVLCGYTSILSPFIWQLWGYPGHAFFSGGAVRRQVLLPFAQVEGIVWSGPGTAYLSNEQSPLSSARLWEIELDVITEIAPQPTHEGLAVVVDPGNEWIRFHADLAGLVRIIDTRGQLVFQQRVELGTNLLSTSSLGAGIYVVSTDTGVPSVRVVIMR